MKQEKFNITLIRDALRCKKDGKISKASYPKAFGDKEKNNFIKTDGADSLLKLNTPEAKSVQDVYNKLEEITNVVMLEVYNNEEIIIKDNTVCNTHCKFGCIIPLDNGILS